MIPVIMDDALVESGEWRVESQAGLSTLHFQFSTPLYPLNCSGSLLSALCSSRYRGVASGSPPSTGMVAPVVGVWWETKKRTAFATCSAVILALRRFRL